MGLFGLTPEQKKFWEENGYVILDIYSPQEVDEMRDAYDDIFNRKMKDSELETQWDGSWKYSKFGAGDEKKLVLAIHNLQCHHHAFSKSIMNKKLADAAADCVGSPNVLLHHTKAHMKPPEKGSAYPPHQDYPYFPHKNHSMIAAVVHLDDASVANGCLYVFPGSHKLGPLENKSDQPDVYHVDHNMFPMEKGVPAICKKGQVLFFTYFTVHASYPNLSSEPRRMYLIQMMAAEDEPTKDVHRNPCQGFVMRGRNVKQNADMKNRFESSKA